MKGNLIYATRYGSTTRVGQWIAEGLRHQETTRSTVTEPPTDLGAFVVLGTPIFVGKPAAEMCDFIAAYKKALCQRPIFVFITSWAESTPYRAACDDFLALLRQYLYPCVPALEQSLPGRLLWHELTSRDRGVMTRLLRRIDARAPDFHAQDIAWRDNRNEERCRQFGERIDRWLQHE